MQVESFELIPRQQKHVDFEILLKDLETNFKLQILAGGYFSVQSRQIKYLFL